MMLAMGHSGCLEEPYRGSFVSWETQGSVVLGLHTIT